MIKQNVEGLNTIRNDCLIKCFIRESGNVTIDTFMKLSDLINGAGFLDKVGLDALSFEYAKFCMQMTKEGSAGIPIFHQDMIIDAVHYELDCYLVFHKETKSISVDFLLTDSDEITVSEISVYADKHYATETKNHLADILAHHMEKETPLSSVILERSAKVVNFLSKNYVKALENKNINIERYVYTPAQFILDHIDYLTTITIDSDYHSVIDYIIGSEIRELTVRHNVDCNASIVERLREINLTISEDDAIKHALNQFFSADPEFLEKKKRLARVQRALR